MGSGSEYSYTVEGCLRASRSLLAQPGSLANPNDAILLFQAVLDLSASQIYMNFQQELDEAVRGVIDAGLKRLILGEPLAYVLGHATFYGRLFEVNSHVLIPRPETELLVNQVMSIISADKGVTRLLDIGVGSGTIAVTVAAECRDLGSGVQVAAWDISKDALVVAGRNAQNHGVAIDLECCDGTEVVADDFDIVVSNPPYIDPQVIEELAVSVKDFEPRLALDGGEGGFDFYRAFCATWSTAKRPRYFLFEIGYDQADALVRLFVNKGWPRPEILKDLSGHDRVLCMRR